MKENKGMIERLNVWLNSNSAFSNLFGIFAVTFITILVTYLPFHPAQKSLKTARRANTIAENSLDTATKAISFTKKRV